MYLCLWEVVDLFHKGPFPTADFSQYFLLDTELVDHSIHNESGTF